LLTWNRQLRRFSNCSTRSYSLNTRFCSRLIVAEVTNCGSRAARRYVWRMWRICTTLLTVHPLWAVLREYQCCK
jgi:hypothetical protein